MTIIITDDDVRRLLPMRECIAAMRTAFRDFADGSSVNRPRMRYRRGAGAGGRRHRLRAGGPGGAGKGRDCDQECATETVGDAG